MQLRTALWRGGGTRRVEVHSSENDLVVVTLSSSHVDVEQKENRDIHAASDIVTIICDNVTLKA